MGIGLLLARPCRCMGALPAVLPPPGTNCSLGSRALAQAGPVAVEIGYHLAQHRYRVLGSISRLKAPRRLDSATGCGSTRIWGNPRGMWSASSSNHGPTTCTSAPAPRWPTRRWRPGTGLLAPGRDHDHVALHRRAVGPGLGLPFSALAQTRHSVPGAQPPRQSGAMSYALTNDTFLRACRRQEYRLHPLWLMRQAAATCRLNTRPRAPRPAASWFGHQRGLRHRGDFAAAGSLPLDAAILFSDILTVPDAMGLGLSFAEGEGPRFAKWCATRPPWPAGRARHGQGCATC